MEVSYLNNQTELKSDDDEDVDETQYDDDKDEDEIKHNTNCLVKCLQIEEEFHSRINYSEPIHIFLKMKPFSKQEIAKNQNLNCYKLLTDTQIRLNPPKTSVYSKNATQLQKLSRTVFKFSYIFESDINQQDFFQASIYPCINKLLNGDNLLIMSYGVTNSGKTYTMQGTNSNPGLIPRTLDVLFSVAKDNLDSKASYKFKPDKFNEMILLNDTELQQEISYKEQMLKMCGNIKEYELLHQQQIDANMSLFESSKFCFSTESLSSIGTNFKVADTNGAELVNDIKIPPDTKYTIWISFYELYNDAIYDLLVPQTKKDDKRNPLKIREDINRIPYVEGLVQVPVFNTYEAIKILKYGEKNLQKASNSINVTSSRSHAVFSLKIVCISHESNVTINQLNFCDLAGIERTSKTNAQGKIFKEALNINTSLLALSRCLNTLMYNQKNKNNQMQVPYRENKLTRLFQAFFEGHGMIKMIVTINPSANCFDETVSVLNFSKIADKVQISQNDDDKVQYKIDPNATTNKSVAWMDEQVDDDDEEESEEEEMEEDEEENDEEEEDMAEETEQTIEGADEEDEEENASDEEEEVENDEDDDDSSKDAEDDDEEEDETKNESDDEKDETKQNETKEDNEDFDKLTKDEIVQICKNLKDQLNKLNKNRLEVEISLRAEIGAKWNKRISEMEIRYKDELKVLQNTHDTKQTEHEKKYVELEKSLKAEFDKKYSQLNEKHGQLEGNYRDLNDKCTELARINKELSSNKVVSTAESKEVSIQTDESQRLIELKKKYDDVNYKNVKMLLKKNELEQKIEKAEEEKNQLMLRLTIHEKQLDEAKIKNLEFAQKLEQSDALNEQKLREKQNEIDQIKSDMNRSVSQAEQLKTQIEEYKRTKLNLNIFS